MRASRLHWRGHPETSRLRRLTRVIGIGNDGTRPSRVLFDLKRNSMGDTGRRTPRFEIRTHRERKVLH